MMTFGRPQDCKELFNLRHASLRNVIERIFGILKKRFPAIISSMEYSREFQIQMVLAACVLHNFIRISGGAGDYWEQLAQEDFLVLDPTADSDIADDGGSLDNTADEWRDQIALAMWADYQTQMTNRQLGSR